MDQKTNKELTVDVVNTFIQSWNAKSGTSPLKADDVTDLIKCVYNTINSLEK